MGAFAALFIPVMIVCYFFVLAIIFFVLFNMDGIIVSLTHNRHKKLLMGANISVLGLIILYFIFAKIFGDAVYRGGTIALLLAGIIVPGCIFNMIILRFFHKKERKGVKVRNVVCVLFVVLSVFVFNAGSKKILGISPLGLWYSAAADEYLEYENYYRIMKRTVMDYTYDNGDDSDKVYRQLKKRLERKDSDINKRNRQKPYYAILNVCEDRYGEYSIKRYDMLKLLVEHGADVTVRDEDGQCVLHRLCCAYDSEEELYRCFKLLIEHDADVNAKVEGNGATVLEYIDSDIENSNTENDFEAKKGLEKIRKLLLDNGAVEEDTEEPESEEAEK